MTYIKSYDAQKKNDVIAQVDLYLISYLRSDEGVSEGGSGGYLPVAFLTRSYSPLLALTRPYSPLLVVLAMKGLRLVLEGGWWVAYPVVIDVTHLLLCFM